MLQKDAHAMLTQASVQVGKMLWVQLIRLSGGLDGNFHEGPGLS